MTIADLAWSLTSIMMICATGLWFWISYSLAIDLRRKLVPNLMAWCVVTFIWAGVLLALIYLGGQWA